MGLYTLSSRRDLCMGCRITKGVTEQCTVRLHLTLDSMKDSLISWKNKIEKPEMVTIKTMIL